MQQTVPNNQVSGTDQQEEVQLTELLPVQPSRIRESNIFQDVDVTDALKALRSFSDDRADDDKFVLTFNFDDKVEETPKQIDKDKQEASSGPKKRQKLRKTKDHSKAPRKTRRNGKIKKNKSCLSNKKRAEIIHHRTVTRIGYAIKRNLTTEYINMGKTLNLELDKNDCFKDEVYVFRREPFDPAAVQTETEKTGRINNSSLLKEMQNGDENPKDKSDNDEESDSSSRDDSSEKGTDLRTKIDTIIQSSILLQQENNNVVSDKGRRREGREEGEEDEEEDEEEDAPGLARLTDDSRGMDESGNSKENQKEQGPKDACEKKYCCIVCDARFKGSGGLRNHYKVIHGAGPVFKCDDCGKEFPLKERLKLHVRTHTGFKPYKCSECDKSFARGGQLAQHRRTHSQIKPYRCALCSGTFTCAANLALHVKRHNGQKDHKCEICGRGFVRRDALKKHLECLHRDVKSFLCVICNKTFKGHLPQHMRTHAKDRPHGCATCGQRFAQKSQLTVHQRTHSGLRPFRCLVCWQAFAHSTALKLHTRRHTGERPFKCAECNAGFTQLPHWKKHMKCIHGRNDPYCCKKCNNFFRIKSDLESHEKSCIVDAEPDIDDPKAVNEIGDKDNSINKFRVMSVEKMRLLLAVLLKRISKQERLDELGFGKRLIDEVLIDSLTSAGKDPVVNDDLNELEALTKNLEIFLEWTVPKEHWEKFKKMKKSAEDILETLTAT
ncbi:zinc finger protein 37-like [Prorops nasuta]|uniref:zinc finger protein 37-like n=1 Tax=Prorops nasuta TaxID=863751 RepID=UPI0034CDAA64